MRYCQRCLIPDTRPHIQFNAEGVCNACEAHTTRPRIDWRQREEAFCQVVNYAKERSKGHDCLIPVSGGKDSTWQVVKCLEYGLNPLAVTWRPPGRTDIGSRNLVNLVNLGLDHIDYQVNPRVEKKFTYQALVHYGSMAIPMHMALFSIPLRIAVKFEIPLVIWGENSAFEYGAKEEERTGFRLDSHWLRQFGVTQGTTAQDWVSDSLSAQELTPYFWPSDQEMERKGVQAVFLGYYFPWDPLTSLEVAQAHGFQVLESPKTGYYNYADIDDDFISIHHFLKWYKFGFTRSFDNLSLEIRNGRVTREQAIQILRERGDETPYEDIVKFCKFLDITTEHFWEVIEKFRNLSIWIKEREKWVIKDFLITDWDWT